jgi:hypothetical protein
VVRMRRRYRKSWGMCNFRRGYSVGGCRRREVVGQILVGVVCGGVVYSSRGNGIWGTG